MRSPTRSATISVKDLCVLALYGALIFAAKAALAVLPNINVNAVLIIIITLWYGWRAMYSVAVYVMLEGLIFGGGIWWFGYLYTWPLLVAICMLFRRNDSAVIWAVIAAVFGLIFGPLMYLEYFAILGGWEMFFVMWVRGIPFDLTHCAGNFALTLALYHPLCAVMRRMLGEPKTQQQQNDREP